MALDSVITADYHTRVLRGLVPGLSMVHIDGHDGAVTTTKTTLSPTLTTLNIDQSGLAASAITVDIASTNVNDTSAGTGLQTVQIIGLDASGNVQTETKALNGQAEVTTSKTWSAINGMLGISWGNGKSNAGTVWCGNGTFTAGVPATKYSAMEIGLNRATTAYHVVQAGHTLYIKELHAFLGSSGKDVEFFIEHSADGVSFIADFVFEIESGALYNAKIISLSGYSAGMHIRVEVKSSVSATSCAVVLACELINESTFVSNLST